MGDPKGGFGGGGGGGGSLLGGVGDILGPKGGFAQTGGGKKLFRQGVGTGFSTLAKGRLSLDPSIRALQEEQLGLGREAFGRFRERTDVSRARLAGNRGALMEARTRPVTELVNRQLQGLSRRGLGGSSFQQQAAETGAVALGDVRAQAEMETLEAISGIDRNQLAAAFELASQMGEVGSARLKQELAGLGLGLEQIQQIIDSFEAGEKRKVQERKNITEAIEGGFEAGKGMGGKPKGGTA